MAQKKDDKKAKTAVKTVAPKVKAAPKSVATAFEEPKYPAAQIAQSLNISDFVFFAMKKAEGIDDGSFLTISQFQRIQNKITKGR